MTVPQLIPQIELLQVIIATKTGDSISNAPIKIAVIYDAVHRISELSVFLNKKNILI